MKLGEWFMWLDKNAVLTSFGKKDLELPKYSAPQIFKKCLVLKVELTFKYI